MNEWEQKDIDAAQLLKDLIYAHMRNSSMSARAGAAALVTFGAQCLKEHVMGSRRNFDIMWSSLVNDMPRIMCGEGYDTNDSGDEHNSN